MRTRTSLLSCLFVCLCIEWRTFIIWTLITRDANFIKWIVLLQVLFTLSWYRSISCFNLFLRSNVPFYANKIFKIKCFLFIMVPGSIIPFWQRWIKVRNSICHVCSGMRFDCKAQMFVTTQIINNWNYCC